MVISIPIGSKVQSSRIMHVMVVKFHQLSITAFPWTVSVDGCQDTAKGENYLGAINRTVSGHRCRYWNEVDFWASFDYLPLDQVGVSWYNKIILYF